MTSTKEGKEETKTSSVLAILFAERSKKKKNVSRETVSPFPHHFLKQKCMSDEQIFLK